MAIIMPYSRRVPTETSIVKEVVNTNTLVYLKVIRIRGIDWNVFINLGISE